MVTSIEREQCIYILAYPAKEKATVSKKRGKRDQTWAKRQYFGPLDGREPSFYT
jgi:hypothetical protein